ncbi:hypothetical protein RSOL_412360 [Rhizoctonia solani AG-3 Rhs1AP]|nr:hypothetical protein RSOL_412360 [Rhizoctonia solani AG-3 Rhs1AP]KEP51068.1 hypothetical protein V565_068170 [Rhizoctonia solani 123E]
MFMGLSAASSATSKREISTLEDDEDYLDRPRKKIFTTNPVPPPFVKQRDFAYGPGAAERIREGIVWALEVQKREEEREAEMRRRRDESLAKYHAEMQAKRKQEGNPGVPVSPRVPLGPPNGNTALGK